MNFVRSFVSFIIFGLSLFACSAEHSTHSNNVTWPAVLLTMLSIPSYACTSVTVAADSDDSAYCRALTMTVFWFVKPAVSMASL